MKAKVSMMTVLLVSLVVLMVSCGGSDSSEEARAEVPEVDISSSSDGYEEYSPGDVPDDSSEVGEVEEWDAGMGRDAVDEEGEAIKRGINVQATMEAMNLANKDSQDIFKLKVGESKKTADVGTFLDVTLVEIVEDTRCPVEDQCPSLGQAKITVDIKSGGIPFGKTSIILEEGQTEPTIKRLGKFSVAFVALDPYPGTVGAADAEPDYEATLYVFLN